ncbi:MAG: dihydropteroate synthase [Chitinophagaceae bacterium]|nr:dihydropteroate synthase [Chitinophagaceae bacterium]
MLTLNCKGRLLTLDKPVVMGIINTTPDSFYAGSRHTALAEVVTTAQQMLADGATILDLGGQSTRPGSEQIGANAEIDRVAPAIEAVHKAFPEAFISVDTYHAAVAKAAVAAGASIVNDISGGLLDPEMLGTVADLQAPYVCMHMQGNPANMQQNPLYSNVVTEVLDFFIQQVAHCRQTGIKDVIIDPGFGFGKTIQHNFQLLKQLQAFQMLGCPLLLGVSRKSTIYKTLNTTAAAALNGTTVLNTIGLMHGARILRVHDVREAVEAIQLYTAMQQA